MEYTTLGRTGLRVTRSGFGALPLYKPPPGVYTDRKGGMLDAANLPVD